MVCASMSRHQAFGEVSTFPTQLISCLREGPPPNASICLDKNRPVLWDWLMWLNPELESSRLKKNSPPLPTSIGLQKTWEQKCPRITESFILCWSSVSWVTRHSASLSYCFSGPMQVRPRPNLFPSFSLSSLLINGISLRSCAVQNLWFFFIYCVCRTKHSRWRRGDSGSGVLWSSNKDLPCP